MLAVELSTRAGVPLGPVVDAHARGVARGVKRPRTARFAIGPGNAMGDVLRTTDQVLARVYDVDNDGTRRLQHCGPVLGYQRSDGEGGLSIQISSTGPDALLARRLVRRGDAPVGGVIIQTGGPRDDLIRSLNNDLSGIGGGTSGNYDLFAMAATYMRVVWVGGSGVGTLPTYKPDLYQPASDVLSTLSSGLDGPDWHVYPVEPQTDIYGLWYGGLATGSAWGVIATGPNIGSVRPNVIFEFGGNPQQGGRANVTGYTEIIDASQIINSVYSLPPTNADYGVPSLGVLNQQDAGSIAAHGLLEAVLPDSLTDPTLRNQLLLDHIAVRKDPRRVIAFTVAVDPDPGNTDLTTRSTVPRVGIDYDFGDIITFRAWETYPVRDDSGTILDTAERLAIDVQMRVYDVDVAEDDQGRRTTTLVTVAE